MSKGAPDGTQPLVQQHCEACRADAPRLADGEIHTLMRQVPDWEVVEEDDILRLRRLFKFANWAQAMAFVQQVSELAEREDHHPAVGLEWGQVVVWWWTHKIRGLHRNDFVSAARTDAIYSSQ